MKNSPRKVFSITTSFVLALTMALAPLAPIVPLAAAASFINTTAPSNANLASGLVLRYSFDNTKVNVQTGAITDESGNGKDEKSVMYNQRIV